MTLSEHEAMQCRRQWSKMMMGRAPRPIPKFGSPEWHELPESSTLKVAAVVLAAECYARQGDNLEEDLHREVEAMSLAHKRAEDASYVAEVDGHRERWKHLRVIRFDQDGTADPPRDLFDIGREAVGRTEGPDEADIRAAVTEKLTADAEDGDLA